MEREKKRWSHGGKIQARGLFLTLSLTVNKSGPLEQLWTLIVETDINFTAHVGFLESLQIQNTIQEFLMFKNP